MAYVLFFCLMFFVVLAVAAMSGSMSERSGVINLSIESYIVLGGLNYAIMAFYFKGDSSINYLYHQIWLIPLSGILPLFGAVIYSFVTITLRANQTIAGIALNTLSLAFVLFFFASGLNKSDNPSYMIVYDKILSFGSNQDDYMHMLNIGLLYGVLIIGFIFVLLNKTQYGVKLKTAGENPQAAASLGMNVNLIRYSAVMISAFFSGIAGAIFFQFQGKMFDANTLGVGFLAVAMVIFGQWRPSYILISSFIFGVMFGLIAKITLIHNSLAHIPQELVKSTPYLITLIVLLFTQRNSKSPKAVGIPYVKSGR